MGTVFQSWGEYSGVPILNKFLGFNYCFLAEETEKGEHKQMFMFRTVSMVIVFVVLLVMSQIFELVQKRRGIGILATFLKIIQHMDI